LPTLLVDADLFPKQGHHARGSLALDIRSGYDRNAGGRFLSAHLRRNKRHQREAREQQKQPLHRISAAFFNACS
jgi:hypothetical protein